LPKPQLLIDVLDDSQVSGSQLFGSSGDEADDIAAVSQMGVEALERDAAIRSAAGGEVTSDRRP
jgi:hypothetical protein